MELEIRTQECTFREANNQDYTCLPLHRIRDLREVPCRSIVFIVVGIERAAPAICIDLLELGILRSAHCHSSGLVSHSRLLCPIQLHTLSCTHLIHSKPPPHRQATHHDTQTTPGHSYTPPNRSQPDPPPPNRPKRPSSKGEAKQVKHQCPREVELLAVDDSAGEVEEGREV